MNYNFALILEYRPNVTQWLSALQRQRLRAAGERIRALPPAQGNTVLERLAIDLSWASSYLEGNTYTLLDTERLLVEGRDVAGHSAQKTRMILNHKAALDYLREHATRNSSSFSKKHGRLKMSSSNRCFCWLSFRISSHS